MFVRFFQVVRYIFPYVDKKAEKDAVAILNEQEKKLYFEMTAYDRSHSLAVYRDMIKIGLKNEEKDVMLKVALLHDIGKGRGISFFDRVTYVIFKNNDILAKHSEKGYEKLKEINSIAAEIVKEHHNKNSTNPMVKIFIEIDDKN